MTDSNNCQGFSNITVAEPAALTLSTGSIDADCGSSNGSAIVSVSGGISPYTYLWDGNTGSQTTDTATNLMANAYNVTITDRSEEHTSELQSHSFISYAVFCLKKKIRTPVTFIKLVGFI